VERTEDSTAPSAPALLRLTLEPGEPLTGTVSAEDDPAKVTTFCGWIELMAAIDVAREHGSAAVGDRSSGRPERA
jgi:hypothetical protein